MLDVSQVAISFYELFTFVPNRDGLQWQIRHFNVGYRQITALVREVKENVLYGFRYIHNTFSHTLKLTYQMMMSENENFRCVFVPIFSLYRTIQKIWDAIQKCLGKLSVIAWLLAHQLAWLLAQTSCWY